MNESRRYKAESRNQTEYVLYDAFYIRASQPWHYWHFEPDNSLKWGIVLCMIGGLRKTSLASTYIQ